MAMIFGTVEEREGRVGLKDLATGEQWNLSVEDAVARLVSTVPEETTP